MSYSPKWDAAATARRYFSTAIPLNQANTDVATFTGLPAKYIVTAFRLYDASGTPVLATIGLRTAASGAGTAMVTAATVTALTSAGATLPMAVAVTDYQSAATLYVRTVVANVAAVTVSAMLEIVELV